MKLNTTVKCLAYYGGMHNDVVKAPLLLEATVL